MSDATPTVPTVPTADSRALTAVIAAIEPASASAYAEAVARQSQLTKPQGSLGAIEEVGCRLAAIAGVCPPPAAEPVALAIFAGDHGVHAQGVSPWPQEVTTQMVANLEAGGAVASTFAALFGARMVIVDVGVNGDLIDLGPAVDPARRVPVRSARVADGTADLSTGPAMTRQQALAALEVGIAVATEAIDGGAAVIVGGEMGIANTTASAALICVFTGAEPAVATGRGTGIDDATLRRKIEVIEAALAVNRPDAADPVGALAAVGGLELAALAGYYLGAAARRVPIVLDGVISAAAACVACALAPETSGYLIAGHRSAEPGASLAMTHLGVTPLLDLGLRLGEGSGAMLAVPLVQAAARVLRDVATLGDAGIDDAGTDDTGPLDRAAAGVDPESARR